jgi:pSer/pThr/pTyr-binding forkhead associated (FHA) protein
MTAFRGMKFFLPAPLLNFIVRRREDDWSVPIGGELQMASPQLHVRAGNLPAAVYFLEKEETVLGRSPDCDVVIPTVFLSRRHARIIRIDGQFFVEDLNTLSGTRVNGRGVSNQIRRRTLLRTGDTIWFDDDIVVQFQE